MEAATKKISRGEIEGMIRIGDNLSRPKHPSSKNFTFEVKIRSEVIDAYRNNASVIGQIDTVAESYGLKLSYVSCNDPQNKEGTLRIRLEDGVEVFGRGWHEAIDSTNLVEAADEIVELLGEMVDHEDARRQLLRNN